MRSSLTFRFGSPDLTPGVIAPIPETNWNFTCAAARMSSRWRSFSFNRAARRRIFCSSIWICSSLRARSFSNGRSVSASSNWRTPRSRSRLWRTSLNRPSNSRSSTFCKLVSRSASSKVREAWGTSTTVGALRRRIAMRRVRRSARTLNKRIRNGPDWRDKVRRDRSSPAVVSLT